MANEHTIDASNTGPAPEATVEESAADRATLTANQPLKILNDEIGSDPYNHTGRFSAPIED